jgi:hypothetical protein
VGDHLDAGIGEILARAVPETGDVPVAEEDAAAQLLAEPRHTRLDALGDLRRGVEREEQVVLQVPAQILAIRRGDRQLEGRVRGHPPARAFERHLDAVAARRRLGVLGQAQEPHAGENTGGARA